MRQIRRHRSHVRQRFRIVRETDRFFARCFNGIFLRCLRRCHGLEDGSVRVEMGDFWRRRLWRENFFLHCFLWKIHDTSCDHKLARVTDEVKPVFGQTANYTKTNMVIELSTFGLPSAIWTTKYVPKKQISNQPLTLATIAVQLVQVLRCASAWKFLHYVE